LGQVIKCKEEVGRMQVFTSNESLRMRDVAMVSAMRKR
jgi:hypothetical protein